MKDKQQCPNCQSEDIKKDGYYDELPDCPTRYECIDCEHEGLEDEFNQDEDKDTHLQGWECPRCYTIHGPFVSLCHCPPPSYTGTTI